MLLDLLILCFYYWSLWPQRAPGKSTPLLVHRKQSVKFRFFRRTKYHKVQGKNRFEPQISSGFRGLQQLPFQKRAHHNCIQQLHPGCSSQASPEQKAPTTAVSPATDSLTTAPHVLHAVARAATFGGAAIWLYWIHVALGSGNHGVRFLLRII